MGKFDFEFDSELTRQLERLSDYDNIAPKILEGAVTVLERFVKAETAKHKDTGDMHKSVRAGKPNKNKYGWYVSVYPRGKDSKGVRNMEKMAHLEYGYIDKSGKQVAPEPILTKSLNDAREEVSDKMQELFNEVVEGL